MEISVGKHAGGRRGCCTVGLAGNKQNRKDGKNKQDRGELLLIAVGNLVAASGLNV